MAPFVRYSGAAILVLVHSVNSQDAGLSVCSGEELRQASAGCTSASACEAAAEQMGLTIGSPTFGFRYENERDALFFCAFATQTT